MGIKDWRVEISEFGVSSALYDGTVQAATWLAALQESRAQLGEQGGLPAGASCNVSADGIVIIQDPRERRRYRLVPGEAITAENSPEKEASRPRAERQAMVPEPPVPKAAAPMPGSPPSTPSDALEARRGPRKSSSPAAAELIEGELVLLSARDESPSPGSPLSFRERLYAVPKATPVGATEKLATRLLNQAKEGLSSAKGGKFVRIEIFDHVWKSSPDRPPVVRIEWKDWHTSVDIDFPLSEQNELAPPPALTSVPPAASTEDRLPEAFEACHDLMFLRNRAEAMHFAARLLEDLVSCEAVTAALLDLDSNEFRFVGARGIGVESLIGRAVPASAGLLRAAASLGEHTLLTLADATSDPRFDPAIDGIPGLDTRALLYRPLIHGNRLYGMLRLTNGPQRPRFSQTDCEVVDYIAEQVSVFLARGSSWPPPPN